MSTANIELQLMSSRSSLIYYTFSSSDLTDDEKNMVKKLLH